VQAAMRDLRQRFGSDLVDEVPSGDGDDRRPCEASDRHSARHNQNLPAALGKDRQADAYGNLGQHVRKCLQYLDVIKEHHSDCQLWSLDHNAIASVYSYWCNRPRTKRGNQCSRRHAQLVMQEINRLLHWIDNQPQYRWTLPKGVDDLSRKPVNLPEDHKKHATAFRSVVKKTYTPEQLAVIAQQADPLGRAIIGVCVNCAWGASEVGQWRLSDYQLHAPHPHAEVLRITSDDKDSWIVGRRPKTGIYGGTSLVGRGARALKPFLDGRESWRSPTAASRGIDRTP